jgi:hypothetical protein
MPIFINYRREDSQAITGRIDDHLRQRFGDEDVFLDIDSIPLGVDFVAHIRESLSQCDVCIAVIGRHWICSRLFDANDFVRLELEEVLRLNVSVIPLLVEEARMPTKDDVPAALVPVLTRNGLRIDSGRDFRVHIDRLMEGIEDVRRRRPSLASLSSHRHSTSVAPEDEHAGSTAGEDASSSEVEDAQGFYTAVGAAQLIQSRFSEHPKAPLLLFRTERQRTWIVATTDHVYCLLDDVRTRQADRTVQWRISRSGAQPIRAYITPKGNHVVDIGDKRRWLYSKRLHSNANELERVLRALVFD